uniref:Rieske domain-containing protein n=1 Tax=Nothoprocta perdicaria TaxID=30464 RepID=A0A8C7E8C6_NOTPE
MTHSAESEEASASAVASPRGNLLPRDNYGASTELLGGQIPSRLGCWPGGRAPKLLREVTVAGYPVLLVRSRTQFSALGSRCPHYGAPLSRGVLRGNRLRCPWHGSCFDVRTGDIEEYPALDCLPRFQVRIPAPAPAPRSCSPSRSLFPAGLGIPGPSPSRLQAMWPLAVGVAALVCAETLRQEGFTGRIIMATREKHLPYDKSKLSKVCAGDGKELALVSARAAGPILPSRLLPQAMSVDFQRRRVRFQNGSSQRYDHLLIATGSHPIPLEVPGADLQNICLLQTPEDSRKILELSAGRNLVIIGASFIGMEVAAFLSDKAAAVSVVEKKEFPFQNVLGPQVGAPCPALDRALLFLTRVTFHMKAEVSELKGKDGKVTEAVLDSGTKIPADVVVVGIGEVQASRSRPAALSAFSAPQRMRTSVPNVYAAGDVAAFPVALLHGQHSNIQHQQVAEAHGHVAAFNMLKEPKELRTVPFFWTTMLGKSIRYAGRWEQRQGDARSCASPSRDGYVVAAASLNCDPMVPLIAEVLSTPGPLCSASPREQRAKRQG